MDVAPLKILVIGASGRTGWLVAEKALSRGHLVTAMFRSAATSPANPGLRVVIGDPTAIDELAPAFAGQDIVISCLGQRSATDAHLLRNAASAALVVGARTRVTRYLVVSQGLLFPSKNPIVSMLRWILARHVADSTAMERLVRASDMEWTIVRPTRLTETSAPSGYTFNADNRPTGAASMGRIDLAAFLVEEAEQGRFKRALVGVTSR
jgi:putative NADH-flavin reductase